VGELAPPTAPKSACAIVAGILAIVAGILAIVAGILAIVAGILSGMASIPTFERCSALPPGLVARTLPL
jgi:hypothetical protein